MNSHQLLYCLGGRGHIDIPDNCIHNMELKQYMLNCDINNYYHLLNTHSPPGLWQTLLHS